MQIFLLLFLCMSLKLIANEHAIKLAVEERDYKKAIVLQIQKIKSLKAEDKSAALYELSDLYAKDQDLELSLKTFLEALEFISLPSKNHDCHVKPFDQTVYDQAFLIYLNPNDTPNDVATKLLNLLLPHLKKHSDEVLLEYYVAIAYANLGKYEDFFKHFYTVYQSFPEHYLSYRTKAILYAKILEREGIEEKRSKLRQLILHNLKLSLNYEPRDTTIYKLIITFADKEFKSKEINQCLNKILKTNIIIPRTDLLFYVHAAVAANELNAAVDFVERAKEWYPKSRLVSAAFEYLNGQRGASCNE